jgi:serine/threonine protein kinase
MRANSSQPNPVAQVFAFMPDSPNNSVDTNSLPEYIAHYRILRRLGKGGMGEVFLAEEATRSQSRFEGFASRAYEVRKSFASF